MYIYICIYIFIYIIYIYYIYIHDILYLGRYVATLMVRTIDLLLFMQSDPLLRHRGIFVVIHHSTDSNSTIIINNIYIEQVAKSNKMFVKAYNHKAYSRT